MQSSLILNFKKSWKPIFFLDLSVSYSFILLTNVFLCRFSQELQLKVQKDARNISLSKKSQNRKKEKEKDDSLSEERKTLVVQVNVHILISVLKFKFNISISFWRKKWILKYFWVVNKFTFSFIVKMYLL